MGELRDMMLESTFLKDFGVGIERVIAYVGCLKGALQHFGGVVLGGDIVQCLWSTN